MGGFLFGYDIGVISGTSLDLIQQKSVIAIWSSKKKCILGVLAMPTFPTYFGMSGDPAYMAQVKGDVVSLLQAGCCAGALLINFFAGKSLYAMTSL